MLRIFAYIQHAGGVASDSAAELVTASKKIYSNAAPTAIVAGYGSDLDGACSSVRALYGEIWKVNN